MYYVHAEQYLGSGGGGGGTIPPNVGGTACFCTAGDKIRLVRRNVGTY